MDCPLGRGRSFPTRKRGCWSVCAPLLQPPVSPRSGDRWAPRREVWRVQRGGEWAVQSSQSSCRLYSSTLRTRRFRASAASDPSILHPNPPARPAGDPTLRTADPETPGSLGQESPSTQLQRDWGDLIFSPTELPFSSLSKPDVTLGKLPDLIFKIIPWRGWLASSGPAAQESWPWLTETRLVSEEREGVHERGASYGGDAL